MLRDRRWILSEARIKLHLAEDLVRWAMSAETSSVIPNDEWKDILEKLKTWERKLTDLSRKV